MSRRLDRLNDHEGRILFELLALRQERAVPENRAKLLLDAREKPNRHWWEEVSGLLAERLAMTPGPAFNDHVHRLAASLGLSPLDLVVAMLGHLAEAPELDGARLVDAVREDIRIVDLYNVLMVIAGADCHGLPVSADELAGPLASDPGSLERYLKTLAASGDLVPLDRGAKGWIRYGPGDHWPATAEAARRVAAGTAQADRSG